MASLVAAERPQLLDVAFDRGVPVAGLRVCRGRFRQTQERLEAGENGGRDAHERDDHARRDANRLALERGENGGSYHRRKDHGGNSEPEMPVLVPLGFEIVGMLAGVHPPMPRREQLLHFRSPAVCVAARAYLHRALQASQAQPSPGPQSHK